MDIKISEKDNVNMVVMEFDRHVPFSQTIEDFAVKLEIPLQKDGSIRLERPADKYIMIAHQPNEWIEMGYFDLRPGVDLKILRRSSTQNDTIAVTFNFGANYTQQINGQNYVNAEGVVNSLVVNNFGIETTTEIRKGKNLHAFVIRYKKELLKKLFNDLPNFRSNVLVTEDPVILFSDLNAAIINALRSLELYKIPPSTADAYLIGKSYVLISLVVDLLENRNSQKKMKMSAAEYEHLISVRRYITSDWKNPPTIQQVSEHLGMSATKAKVLFKQLYGMPIYEYFSRKRMEEAMKLIDQGELSIAEIGRDLGYRNLGHFAEAFRKRYGILPKKYALANKK